jgi:hypothetical protein
MPIIIKATVYLPTHVLTFIVGKDDVEELHCSGNRLSVVKKGDDPGAGMSYDNCPMALLWKE